MNSHIRITNARKVFVVIVALVVTVAVCLWQVPAYAAMPNYTPDEAVYAVETKSGDVITSQNAHKRMYPASTTKMMTTLVALDYVANRLGEKVTVGDEIDEVTADSSKANLQKGDELTWHQLFYALLLPSGNDAALTIACHVGRLASHDNNLNSKQAIAKFVTLMNKKAKSLGLEDSHFVNPHGLHDPEHYTTAADLEKISAQALKNHTIREVVKTEVYSCNLKSGEKKWVNTNSLIINPNDLSQMQGTTHDGKQYNASATGVKTGHTDEAGRCLVFSSDNGSKKMLAVILHSDNNIFTQANAIINTLNNEYTRVKWTGKSGYYKTVKLSHVHLFNSRSLEVRTLKGQASSLVPKTDKNDYRVRLALKKSLFEKQSNDNYRLLDDIKPGQTIGTMNVVHNGKTVQRIAVTTSETIHARGFSDYLLFIVIIAAVIVIILYLYARKVARERRRREQRRQKIINQKQRKRTMLQHRPQQTTRKEPAGTAKRRGHEKTQQPKRRKKQ